MLMAGAFTDCSASGLAEFVHIQLTGGDPPGRALTAELDADQCAQEAERLLVRLVLRYENPTEPYRSRVAPFRMRDAGDYDHLARVIEWSLADESD